MLSLSHVSAPLAEASSCDTGFHRARRIDIDLEEGEALGVDVGHIRVKYLDNVQVLFVPGGAPHLVVNLTDTVAFAGNFLDDSNLEASAQSCAIVGENGRVVAGDCTDN